MNLQPPDAADRDAARFDLDRNVVVSAGAGTGKTTLLIDRIIFLLLGRSGPDKSALEPSRLVALTFTEKAAAEIKFRLAERLNRVVSILRNPEAPAAESALDGAARRCLADLESRFGRKPDETLRLAEAAIAGLESAQIGTIHSFCSHLLRLFPLEAGVDPDFRVDADARAFEEVFESMWSSWLDAELGDDPPRAGDWTAVLSLTGLADLRELARGLAGPRVDLAAAPPSPAARLRALAERAAGIGRGLPAPRGKILPYLEWVRGRLAAGADWADGRASAPAPPPAASPPKWPKAWEGEPDPEDYASLCRIALALDPAGEELTARAVELLLPFAAAFRSEFNRRGWISFDGLLTGARDLVRDHPAVRRELKRRCRALLIDEFQDTDPIQGELLMLLGESGRAEARDWREARLEPGKLFIVGDPKQSIYRFRGADIAAVESFSERLASEGALQCALRTNFRSQAGLVSAVNGVFEAVMEASPGLQPAYIPILARAQSSAAAGIGPEWIQMAPPASEPDAKVPAAATRRAEAAWIGNWIVEQGSAYRFRDIAIVLRGTAALPVYLEALRSRGIPYVVEGERYFYGTQEVVDFLNLLRVVDDPSDKVSLAGLLRSPLAALDDREIERLARSGGLDPRKRVPGMEGLYGRLLDFHERAGRVPLSDLVRSVLAETYLIELCAEAYHHQQTAGNLLKFGRLAAQACDRGASLKEFIDEIARSRKEFAAEGESPLADEDYDAVRVLTIHKSKGLEYPVVILPNLSGETPGGASRDAVRAGWSDPWIGVRLRSAGAVNAAMVLLDEDERRRQAAEEVRVLYVAMTRSKERLLLLGGTQRRGSSFAGMLDRSGVLRGRTVPIDAAGRAGPAPRRTAGEWTAPDPGPFAADWRRRLAARDRVLKEPVFTHPTEVSPEEVPPPVAVRRRPTEVSPEEVPPPVVVRRRPTEVSPEESPPADSVGLSQRKKTARPAGRLHNPHEARHAGAPPRQVFYAGINLGRLCHEALERWDFPAGKPLAGAGADLAALVAARAAVLAREIPGAEAAALADEARPILREFLASTAGRELARADILGREIPFVFREGGAVVRGTIDLLYRDRDGLVVADYKTDRVGARERAARSEKYARQGAYYVSAVERAFGIKGVRFKVIFLRRS